MCRIGCAVKDVAVSSVDLQSLCPWTYSPHLGSGIWRRMHLCMWSALNDFFCLLELRGKIPRGKRTLVLMAFAPVWKASSCSHWPPPGPSEARGFYHSRGLLAPPSAWPDHREGRSAACVLTAGPVALESDFFFREKIFMAENSTKNMRILIMVLRDVRGESPDIPKYRLYSIFPKRRIASTKDEQP